ncbi:hypothetical protein [Chroococcus sp. FPU101]|uniref:hypothetical protein n=1 Tax=Chroococcus sp. FPU101 TaxID=1974212 RepID=UPI001A8C05F0|nr:hypothetical protein [Chroococcus sp. FPU101]GFE69018.1 hypothetical protein CFPU101_16280 [Chroococcus sp. FPU101]
MIRQSNNQTNYSQKQLKEIFKIQKYHLNTGDLFYFLFLGANCMSWIYRLSGYSDLSNEMFIKVHFSPFFAFSLFYFLAEYQCNSSLPKSIIDLSDALKLALTEDYLLTDNRKEVCQYPLTQIYQTIINNNNNDLTQQQVEKLLYDFVWLNNRRIVSLINNFLVVLFLLYFIHSRFVSGS